MTPLISLVFFIIYATASPPTITFPMSSGFFPVLFATFLETLSITYLFNPLPFQSIDLNIFLCIFSFLLMLLTIPQPISLIDFPCPPLDLQTFSSLTASTNASINPKSLYNSSEGFYFTINRSYKF